MSDASEPTTTQLYAATNFNVIEIDVTARESQSLRKQVKEKYITRAALLELPDSTWVKTTSVRRSAREHDGEYMLAIGVEPGAKASALFYPFKKPTRHPLREDRSIYYGHLRVD